LTSYLFSSTSLQHRRALQEEQPSCSASEPRPLALYPTLDYIPVQPSRRAAPEQHSDDKPVAEAQPADPPRSDPINQRGRSVRSSHTKQARPQPLREETLNGSRQDGLGNSSARSSYQRYILPSTLILHLAQLGTAAFKCNLESLTRGTSGCSPSPGWAVSGTCNDSGECWSLRMSR
jgi:hypothetical protein